MTSYLINNVLQLIPHIQLILNRVSGYVTTRVIGQTCVCVLKAFR